MALSGFLESGKKAGVNGQNERPSGRLCFITERCFKNFDFLFTM